MQVFRTILKYLKINTECWLTLLVLLFVLEIVKKTTKKSLKMTSKLVIFRAFFVPKTLNLKKNPVNQLIKSSDL